MKLFKRVVLHTAAFITAISLTKCFVPSTLAIESTAEAWTEAVDITNYDTWRQDIGDVDYKALGWVEYNISDPVIKLNGLDKLDFRYDMGMEMPSGGKASYTVRRWGSLIYALSKLMVASGAAPEYSMENPGGVNPAILYYAALMTKPETLNGDTISTKIVTLDGTTLLYSDNVDVWHDDAYTFADVMKYYWGTNLSIDNTTSIRKLSDEAKEGIIKDTLDEGKYVILTLDTYKYYDESSDKVVDGHEMANHSLLLTGYTTNEQEDFIDFTIDDSISPCINFKDLYSIKDVISITTFNTTPEIEPQLEFYKGKFKSEPWYLKLIDKDNIVSQSKIDLLNMVNVYADTGSLNLEAMNIIRDTVNMPTDADSIVSIDTRVYKDLSNLMMDMHNEVKDEKAFIDVAFRTLESQAELYSQMSVTYGEDVNKYCDVAGASEHNIGIAVDFKLEGTEDFSKTKSYEWLCQNAHEYGFILRYPNSPKAIETTGKEFNPTHWRFIGAENATKFIQFIDAAYQEDAEGNLTDVEAYINIGYNGKVFEDYYLEVILPTYTNADLSGIVDTDDLSNLEQEKPKYSDATLRRMYYLLRHPVKSFGNLIAGLCQMAHNAIAIGNTGNIYNISWILNWDTVRKLSQPYMIVSICVVCVALILRYLRYMLGQHDRMVAVLRDSGMYIAVSLVPILLLAFVGNCFDTLTGIITKDMSGKIIMLESSYEEPVANDDEIITTWELLTDEDLSKNLFRETFVDSEHGASYDFATIKMTTGLDEYGRISYTEMTVKELFESVSFDSMIEKMTPSRINNSTSYTYYNSTKGITKAILESAIIDNAAPKYLYYSHNQFVPVNYDRYDESVFYYFYDWVKYQYLSYWASDSSDGSKVISNFAKGYVLPGESFDESSYSPETPGMYSDESFDKYMDRVEMLEENYLSKAHSGISLMYNDMEYVHNNDIYYNDLFGLSYLFNMTTGESDKTYAMVDDYYTDAQDVDIWAGVLEVNYINSMPDYYVFRNQMMNGTATAQAIQPLTAIINSPAWEVYKHSGYFHNSTGKGKSYWTFTPDYLAEYYKQPIDRVHQVMDIGRVPWRLYASTAQLDKAYGDKPVEWTNLEQQLCALNENIYKDVYKLSQYMPGQITDDKMIFVVALAATARFNELFDSIMQPVYPKGINSDNLDMDKIIRLTYADTLVSNESLDTMYMIYDSPGGLFIMLIVLIGEVFMLVASATRAMLLVLFFVGVLVLTLNYLRGHMPTRSPLLTGVVSQFVSLIGMHSLLIGSNQLVFNVLVTQDSAMMRVLFSILGTVLYFIVTVVNISMFLHFKNDIKNFGGMMIQDTINTVKASIDLADAETSNAMTNVEMENAELRLQRTIARRIRNVHKITRNATVQRYTRAIRDYSNEARQITRMTNRHSRQVIRNVRGRVSRQSTNNSENE